VVRNPDGGAELWKPGGNLCLTLDTPAAAPGGVAVRDAWDGSVRDVRVEVAEGGGPARPMSDAEREEEAFRESVRGVGGRGVAGGGGGWGPGAREGPQVEGLRVPLKAGGRPGRRPCPAAEALPPVPQARVSPPAAAARVGAGRALVAARRRGGAQQQRGRCGRPLLRLAAAARVSQPRACAGCAT
jgi:hypothetical protein